MLNFRKGNTETVYFTGTENATLTAPYFLFTFTNRTTADVVSIMATNVSTTGRYDKFSLAVNIYFANYDTGFWEYAVREKASNSDMTLTGTVVETGFMFLRAATDFEPTEYSGQSNAFTVYDGQ